ncbi:MAG: metalloregulator ArsR/SmtB family transcription factor [bacterium]|nr:metalloregulator ArsR/SmtB family transcription factor [bacterium]
MKEQRIIVRTANLLKALGHPTRVAVVEFLAQGERCVCEIAPALGVEQPTLSKHLAVLRREGVVVCRKEGLRVIYRLADPRAAAITGLAREFLRGRWRDEGGVWEVGEH